MVKISDKILRSPDHQPHPLIFGKMLVSLLLFSEASLDLHKVKKKTTNLSAKERYEADRTTLPAQEANITS